MYKSQKRRATCALDEIVIKLVDSKNRFVEQEELYEGPMRRYLKRCNENGEVKPTSLMPKPVVGYQFEQLETYKKAKRAYVSELTFSAISRGKGLSCGELPTLRAALNYKEWSELGKPHLLNVTQEIRYRPKK
jgi:hypothetical protein